MPSAENVTSAAAAKHENAPPNEQKSVESTQKEQAADPNEKSVPAIQQALSIISNKVRNLEKRKVSGPGVFHVIKVDGETKIANKNALFFNMAAR